MNFVFALHEIDDTAKKFISYLGNIQVAAFSGVMGAGKTTFIHAVCTQLGVTETMSSPTYPIINQYQSANNKIINHIDLYRLKDTEEAIQAGVEEAINSGDLCLIEWPEKIEAILPLHNAKVFIDIIDHKNRRLAMKLT